MMIRISGYLLVLAILFSGCQNTQPKRFTELTVSQTGINFKNTLSESLELNILNYLYFYNGAGVAAADFNNDGLVDLYFTANQEADQLYLNQGSFQFKNVTEEAKINNVGNWTTGVTHVDINHDGLLDIYICKIGNYRNIKGKNLLYISQGINEEGVPIFKEDAASYGLDFSGFSTQAAFLIMIWTVTWTCFYLTIPYIQILLTVKDHNAYAPTLPREIDYTKMRTDIIKTFPKKQEYSKGA